MFGATTLVTSYIIKLIQERDINLSKDKDLEKGFYSDHEKLVKLKKEAKSDLRNRPEYKE